MIHRFRCLTKSVVTAGASAALLFREVPYAARWWRRALAVPLMRAWVDPMLERQPIPRAGERLAPKLARHYQEHVLVHLPACLPARPPACLAGCLAV